MLTKEKVAAPVNQTVASHQVAAKAGIAQGAMSNI